MKSPADYETFSKLRALCKSLTTTSYQKYCDSIENNLYKNPKFFWKYVRNLNGDNNIPQSMVYDNVTYDNPADAANAFAQSFKSVFSPTIIQNVNRANIDKIVNIDRPQVSLEDVYRGLT